LLAIVPIYNEAEILHKSVESLKRSSYEDVDVCVVCEEDDRESVERAMELGCDVLVNNHPGSKAGAINTAFEERTEYDYYAIFDADEEVVDGFLSKAVGTIEEGGHEAFEGRRIPETRGIVESFGYCERAVFYILFKFMEATGFRNLGSASVVMERDVWERTGGYDDMLTEDIDFHHKSYRARVDVANDRRVNTVMEAPHTWSDFWHQRKRWRMGWVQVLHKTLKGGYDNYLSLRGVYSTSRIFLGVLGTVSILVLVPKMLVLFLLDLDFFYLFPLVSLASVTALISLRDSRYDKVGFLGFNAVLSILVLPFTSFLALKSLVEYVVSGECGWYQVEKVSERSHDVGFDGAVGIHANPDEPEEIAPMQKREGD
ncbi:MAG: glycosyltransferase, partial [Halobacteriota archaeon]